MRALDISKMLVCISLVIGLINGIGVFDEQYQHTLPSDTSGYILHNVSEIGEDLGNVTDLTTWDYAKFTIMMGYEALIMLIKVLLAVVIIYPVLVYTFHIPIVFSVLIQALIWVNYAVAMVQYKKGITFKGME